MNAHIRIGGGTWCAWYGSKRGNEIMRETGVDCCSFSSLAQAEEAARKLRAIFRSGAVRVVPGECPNAPKTQKP